MDKALYLSVPHMVGNETDTIYESLNDQYIAPLDGNILEFEKEFAKKIGVAYAACVSSGTAALHMCLIAAGVETGDVVFCSTLTFAASVNPILYCGAKPVFIDCDEQMCMSIPALESALKVYKPKAMIAVDIYGQCVDYDKLKSLCKDIIIIEDAAEGLGSTYKGKACGTFGDYSAFSFNTNKIITTGGGGMVVSGNGKMIEKIRFWSRQSKDPDFHYLHSELGYNYRMNNIGAGIGRVQLKALEERVEKKRWIHDTYQKAFKHSKYIRIFGERDYGKSTFWFTTIRITKDCPVSTRTIAKVLMDHKIETRPIWKPLHTQPYLKGSRIFSHKNGNIISEYLSEYGLCLPSDITLDEQDIQRVVEIINTTINEGSL